LRISPKRVFRAIKRIKKINKKVNQFYKLNRRQNYFVQPYSSIKFKRLSIFQKNFMNFDTTLLSFGITSLVIGITIVTIYSSFGPGADNLLDPFEEDEE